MDDWQGCLSPLCQGVLLQAREEVTGRGGYAITVEDFLLVLVEREASVSDFLRSRGVDQDELIRTIQCEQPIVTEVSGESLLSSQLQYWLALTRELVEDPWLEWPQLLRVLARDAERLADKAYVALLEQVEHWPRHAPGAELPGVVASPPPRPVVITDRSWRRLAEDLAIALCAGRRSLLWVSAPRGSGKTAWLDALLASLRTRYLMPDLRNEAQVETLIRHLEETPAGAMEEPAPALILDNTSPADLMAMLADPSHPVRRLLPACDAPVLMLSPEFEEDAVSARRLEHVLGRSLVRHDLPGSSASQNRAILVAHQAAIERRWQVELSADAIEFTAAAVLAHPLPGLLVEWLERAAVRVALFAEQGPRECLRLGAEEETLKRQILVALARQEPLADLEAQLREVSLERTAAEADWHERLAAGTLRRVLPEDLQDELASWPEAGDHPLAPGRAAPTPGRPLSPPGDPRAGSGNIRS